jgi:hypothetical protein
MSAREVCNMYLGTLCEYYIRLSRSRKGDLCHYYNCHHVECPYQSEFALKEQVSDIGSRNPSVSGNKE